MKIKLILKEEYQKFNYELFESNCDIIDQKRMDRMKYFFSKYSSQMFSIYPGLYRSYSKFDPYMELKQISLLYTHKISKFLGAGERGMAFEITDFQNKTKLVLKIDCAVSPQNSEVIYSKYKNMQDDLFSGKGDMSQPMIHDVGMINDNFAYIIMNKVKPLTSDQVHLAEELTWDLREYIEKLLYEVQSDKLSFKQYWEIVVTDSHVNEELAKITDRENRKYVKKFIKLLIRKFMSEEGIQDLHSGNVGYHMFSDEQDDKDAEVFDQKLMQFDY